MTMFFGDPVGAIGGDDTTTGDMSPPPLLSGGYPAAQPSTGPSASAVGSGIASFLVNIFGQRVLPLPGQPGYVPTPGMPGYVEPTPVWVYILIPVAIVGGLVFLKKSNRRRSVAGYRRKSRRHSRR